MQLRGASSATMAPHHDARAEVITSRVNTTTSGVGSTPLRPGKTDVLLGRGRSRQMHLGNLRYESEYRLEQTFFVDFSRRPRLAKLASSKHS